MISDTDMFVFQETPMAAPEIEYLPATNHLGDSRGELLALQGTSTLRFVGARKVKRIAPTLRLRITCFAACK